MMTPDRGEIVFAGAGLLWGATTFFRGLHIWRTDPHSSLIRKNPRLPLSIAAGFALIIGCSAYLAWSIRGFSR